jgi:hypothetical protein
MIMNTPPSGSLGMVRTLLVLVAILIGIIVGLVAGILVVASGGGVATAAASGGVAFGGTVPLVLLIERALGLL